MITDFKKISQEVQEQVKLLYPNGFSQYLISITNKEGKKANALRFETEDKIYLFRMSIHQAEQLISEDSDYDEEGILKKDIKKNYIERYIDLDLLLLNDDEDNIYDLS